MTTSAVPCTVESAADPDRTRGRRRWLLPAAFLAAVSAVLGGAALDGEPEPGTPLGAAASVPGGLVRINGLLPEEQDDSPGATALSPEAGTSDGTHLVRVLLEFTALDAEGLDVDAGDWTVERLGGGQSHPAWASVTEDTLQQGEVLHTEFVFELPDRALELTLEGAGGTRLSLGSDHHSGGGSR